MKTGLKNFLVTVIMALMSLLGFSILWCLRTFGRLSMEELVYELSAPLEGTGSDMISRYVVGALVPAIVVVAVILFFGIFRKKNLVIIYGLIASIIFAVTSSAVFFKRLNVLEYLANAGDESTFIEDNYIDPGNVQITFPEKKKNLIYIFLESMEVTYSDIENGGGFKDNLIPELTELAEENECFSGDDKLNGPYPAVGASWTMGAMFAQSSGLPLKILVEGNSMSEEKTFFPGITCIGDILESQGYNQELLIGSDAVFGGRKLFFSLHGNYTFHDYIYAKNNHVIPKDYMVFWGYEDTKLFENAKNDLLELSKGDKPFNLTMLTVDTHHPDGYVCDRCENKYGSNQYANVIACSSKQVSEFVEWIKKQDFYKDTVVVICGDHATMNGDFCNGIDGDYVRKTYMTILNSDIEKKRRESIEYSTMDMFPTTLAAIGAQIDGNRLGLGTNLFSNEKTLLEKFGRENVDIQLAKHSEFMDKMSGIGDEEDKKDKRILPDAEVNVTDYNKEQGTITLKADNIINVDNYTGVRATLYDSDMNELEAFDMARDAGNSYTCEVDISSLEDRRGTIVVETVENIKVNNRLGAFINKAKGESTCKIDEITGDLSLQAHEDLAGYIDLLGKKDDIAVFIASCGDITTNSYEKDLNELRKLGINEHIAGYKNISLYAVIDSPSIVYGSGEKTVEYDGALVRNDMQYHVESAAAGNSGKCSIVIGGDEYALNENGLNFVVYDYELEKVIDSACFDLNRKRDVNRPAGIDMEIAKSGQMKLRVRDMDNFEMWNVLAKIWDKDHCDNPIVLTMEPDVDFSSVAEANLAGYDLTDAYIEVTCQDKKGMKHTYFDWEGDFNLLKGDFADYMSYVSSLDDTIILMSVKDAIWLSQEEEDIETLEKYGIEKFADIGEHEAYYAVITPGGVVEAHGSEELSYTGEYNGTSFTVSGAGWDSGYYSSIVVDGEEYSRGECGINIVVYDTNAKKVVDNTTYRFNRRGGVDKALYR